MADRFTRLLNFYFRRLSYVDFVAPVAFFYESPLRRETHRIICNKKLFVTELKALELFERQSSPAGRLQTHFEGCTFGEYERKE